MGSGMGSGTSSLREMKPDPTPETRPTGDGQPYLGGRDAADRDGQPCREDGD